MIYKKIKYIPQVDELDCGIAALSMILNSYGTEVSLSKLRSMAKTDMEGTTALGIVKAANTLDFETMPIQADLSLFDKKDGSILFGTDEHDIVMFVGIFFIVIF